MTRINIAIADNAAIQQGARTWPVWEWRERVSDRRRRRWMAIQPLPHLKDVPSPPNPVGDRKRAYSALT